MANTYTIYTSTNLANFYTIGGAAGATVHYGSTLNTPSGSNGTFWNGNITTGNTSPSMSVKGDLEVDGTLKVKGRDLAKLMEKIEDRLAILAEPNPDKLEKFPALKKAYDHYKLMEKIIGDD
jgi:hypothetical protein